MRGYPLRNNQITLKLHHKYTVYLSIYLSIYIYMCKYYTYGQLWMLCPFLFSRIVSRKHFPPRNHIYKQPGLLDTHLAGIIQCLCLAEGGAPQLEVGLQTPSTTSVYIYIVTG